MGTWKQGILFLAGQESRECYVFISDVGLCGVYLSLTLDTAKFKQLEKSCSFLKILEKKCNRLL